MRHFILKPQCVWCLCLLIWTLILNIKLFLKPVFANMNINIPLSFHHEIRSSHQKTSPPKMKEKRKFGKDFAEITMFAKIDPQRNVGCIEKGEILEYWIARSATAAAAYYIPNLAELYWLKRRHKHKHIWIALKMKGLSEEKLFKCTAVHFHSGLKIPRN